MKLILISLAVLGCMSLSLTTETDLECPWCGHGGPIPSGPANAVDPNPSAGIGNTQDLQLPSFLELVNPENQKVLTEINNCRANPPQCATKYEAYLSYYNGYLYTKPGSVTYQTWEGTAPVIELINQLKTLQPLPAFTWSDALAKAARDHALDIGVNGLMSHYGTDGSNPVTRVQRYGSGFMALGENIGFGFNLAEDIVYQLLVDDGVAGRGHRKNMLSPTFKVIGADIESHTIYAYDCVIDFVDKLA